MNHEVLIDANDSNEERSDVKNYGGYLRQARESLGFSIDEVAIELHLARDIIEHIEQEILGSLPDPIFVRGYLRAYAKLVQADADRVINAFNRVSAPTDHKPLNLGKHIVIKDIKAGGEKPIRWVTYIIFVGLVILLLMWWHGHSSQNTGTDNGTIAALATLKPVSDGSVSSALSTTAVTSMPSSAAAGPGTLGTAVGATTNAAVSNTNTSLPANTNVATPTVNSPNNVVNTNVQNLAPSANATSASVSPNGAVSAVAGTSQSMQTMANTPTPVVATPPAAASTTTPTSAKAKAPAASAWRNPDLEQ